MAGHGRDLRSDALVGGKGIMRIKVCEDHGDAIVVYSIGHTCPFCAAGERIGSLENDVSLLENQSNLLTDELSDANSNIQNLTTEVQDLESRLLEMGEV